MAMNNRDRLTKGFEYLSEGLVDVVDEVMTKVFGTLDWPSAWAKQDQERYGTALREISKEDPQTQLRAITEYRREFSGILGHVQQAYASELRETRNQWAHMKALSSEETIRALGTIELLLNAVDSTDSANDVLQLRNNLQRTVYEDKTRKSATRKVFHVSPEAGLQPWRQLIRPHDDVVKGTFTASEFAADLHAVAFNPELHRKGNPYGDPVEFFNRTYLTEGLKDLLKRAVGRLVNHNGASPVVNLQTTFGGGKTHSLLALWHLFGDMTFNEMPDDLQELIARMDVHGAWGSQHVNRVAIVGTVLNPAMPSRKPDGVAVRTMWGELAWQLGGAEGYAMVAENDLLGKQPGQEVLGRLLKTYGPSLILIDEWVAYARQLVSKDSLPAGTFDDQFTFAQALTEAVKNEPSSMLVVSIPAGENGASELETGGVNGQKALERLQHVIGRVADQWQPSNKDESFEIVRKRLFEEPTAEARAAIDVTVRKFMDMYRSNPKYFPSHVSRNEYEERMRASYPLHPELLARLYEDWSSLERFQRTRGVLTLISLVVHALEKNEDSAPLILPGDIPLGSESVSSALLQYLDGPWRPVIDTDIAGEDSAAAQVDGNMPILGHRSLAERLARTIFLGSAPRAGMPNPGVDSQHIWLGTAMPADIVGNYNTALDQLTQHSSYLLMDNAHYGYQLQRSIAKLARDYAEQLRGDMQRVQDEIVRRLKDQGKPNNRDMFPRVSIAPANVDGIPDADEVTLVIMHPQYRISAGERDGQAQQWVHDAVTHTITGQRENRNMIVFLAADSSRYDEAAQQVRAYLGWRHIDETQDQLDLTKSQIAKVRRALQNADEQAQRMVLNMYQHCLFPQQQLPNRPFEIESVRVPESDDQSLPQRAGEQLIKDNELILDYAPESMVLEVLEPLKSQFMHGFIDVGTIWRTIARFPYMPRLVNRTVLEQTVRDAVTAVLVSDERFAIATGYDESTQQFRGLILPGETNTSQVSLHVTDRTLIVEWAVAEQAYRRTQEQMAEAPVTHENAATRTPEQSPAEGDVPGVSSSENKTEQAPVPTKFYGVINLDSETMNRQLNEINEQILEEFRLAGASLKITLDIEADQQDGFSDAFMAKIKKVADKQKFTQSTFSEF